MTTYERARIRLRTEMDHELESLDHQRSTMGEAAYWTKFSEINASYSDKVAEIDAAERSHRSLQQIKETGSTHDRPEQKYADVLGQLKAQKITELIDKLAKCSSSSRLETVSANDPFYSEKLDPIGTFERWWEEELQSFPSYDSIQDFLRRIDIDKHGMITIKLKSSDDGVCNVDNPTKSIHLGTVSSEYSEILKADILKTNRQRAKENRQIALQRQRRKTPLLAKGSYLEDRAKRQKQLKQQQSSIDTLCSVVYAYDLDSQLEDLLVEHISSVCVPMGITKEDKYKPMLEQFLRYVTEPHKRIRIVKEAIEKGWRILSDGTI